MAYKRTRGILSAGAVVAAALLSANAGSAATVIDDMGVLSANSSVSGSLSLTYAPSSLQYNFGATGAQMAFSQTVASSTGALDVAFEFEIAGQPLTLVNADAINPIHGTDLQLGPVSGTVGANIWVTDGLGGPVVVGPSYFGLVTSPTHSFDASTTSVTLQPGDYYEYIAGTASTGKTLLNVGAFAGEAVPEPASWALMILGVGMIGTMYRTARRKNELGFALT